MAIVKIIAIRNRLDKRVNYVLNGEKTSQLAFTSTLNCGNVETAYAEMRETKRRFGKEGGVVGYHFIQSFAPHEVTPEQAHAIGVAFAEKLFGGRYEAVIGTHLDKAHPHNHIVVNSVSFVDGEKYHSSPGSYFFTVRGASDDLCRRSGLPVIVPQGKGRHYAEWKAEREGKPTLRSLIRSDIDRTIERAYTFDTFLTLLRQQGYEVRNAPNRKYVTVRPSEGQRAIRLESLGDGYTESDIRRRLTSQRNGEPPAPAAEVTSTVRRYRIKRRPSPVRRKKITGFYALYLRYLYLLRGTHRKRGFRRVPFSLRQEVIRLQRYERQFRYLWSNGLTTVDAVEQQLAEVERAIETGEQQRKPLYAERRTASNEEKKAQVSAEIRQQTAALRELRRQRRLCRDILADVPLIAQQVAEAERQHSEKEVQHHEYQR